MSLPGLAVRTPQLISRAPAATLSKETTRIELRQKKRANCAVYGFGLSASGALAIPKLVVQDGMVTSRETKKPLRIAFFNLREIRKVAAGFGFSLFASRNKLYGAGLNNRFQIAGRLGDESKPKGEGGGGREKYYISGRRVGGLPEDARIVDVSAGRAHSLVIAGDKVYAFGCNVHAQCGVDPSVAGERIAASSNSPFLPQVVLPTNSKPVSVHCTLDTSFVLTEDGKVYSFGLNEDGQCANGEFGIVCEPKEITGDTAGERIVSLAGSTDTIMAIGENGQVFIWGMNEYGQAGPAYADRIQLPFSRALPFTLPRIRRAVATVTTCSLLTEAGSVLTWGVGVLGLGPDVMRLQRPSEMPQTLFEGKKVTSLHSGNVASAAVNEDGTVFVWGQNRYGLLGLGHDKDQLFPYPLFFQGDVKDISISPDHTLVLAK